MCSLQIAINQETRNTIDINENINEIYKTIIGRNRDITVTQVKNCILL